jgi:HPt (histidine-containing phosphotransfer) domain-containing protein
MKKNHSTDKEENVLATPVDMEKLLDISMNDHGLMRELINIFMADAPERISSLRRAIAEKEPQEVMVISHGLRGASRNMTAEKLGELFNHLEELGEAGRIDGAEELMGEVEREFARLQDYFTRVTPIIPSPSHSNTQ